MRPGTRRRRLKVARGIHPHRERDPVGQKLWSEQRPVQGAGLRAGERAGERPAPQRRTRAGAAILRKRYPSRRRPVPRAAVFCGGKGTKRLQSQPNNTVRHEYRDYHWQSLGR